MRSMFIDGVVTFIIHMELFHGFPYSIVGCRGPDRVVVGFAATCAFSAYHH